MDILWKIIEDFFYGVDVIDYIIKDNNVTVMESSNTTMMVKRVETPEESNILIQDDNSPKKFFKIPFHDLDFFDIHYGWADFQLQYVLNGHHYLISIDATNYSSGAGSGSLV